jgi:hypothetical protein
MSGKKVDSVTGEVEVADVVTAAVEPAKRRGDVISAYLHKDVATVDVNPTDTHRQIIEEIMEAQTLDDLLANEEPEDMVNFVGRVIIIRDYSINDSDFAEGAPIYVALKVTDEESGERRVITTGEQNIMAQVITAKERGWLPLKCRPIQSTRPNRHGRYLIRLGKADD